MSIADKYTKHSFQISHDLLKRFQETSNALGLKLFKGLEQALEAFIAKHKNRVELIKEARK